MVRRLTAWQLDPIVAQVNGLQRAIVAMTDTLAADPTPQSGRRGADGDAQTPEAP
jgi:hypothetical protein